MQAAREKREKNEKKEKWYMVSCLIIKLLANEPRRCYWPCFYIESGFTIEENKTTIQSKRRSSLKVVHHCS